MPKQFGRAKSLFESQDHHRCDAYRSTCAVPIFGEILRPTVVGLRNPSRALSAWLSRSGKTPSPNSTSHSERCRSNSAERRVSSNLRTTLDGTPTVRPALYRPYKSFFGRKLSASETCPEYSRDDFNAKGDLHPSESTHAAPREHSIRPKISAPYPAVRDRQYYVYIMASRSQVLYVGMTNNLPRRVREHKRRDADSFTARYNVTRLVWYRGLPRPQDAIAAEKKIKGWIREKKVALIEEENADWQDLAPEVLSEGT